MHIRHFSLFLLLGACAQDSSFTKLSSPEPPAEDTSTPPVETEAEAPPEPAPPECPEAIVPATLFTVDEDCFIPEETWPFYPVVEWKMDTFVEHPTFVSSFTAPVVGHLTDDDGDDRLGSSGDIPDIVSVHWDSTQCWPSCPSAIRVRAVLRMISGDGSLVHWTVGELPHNGAVYGFQWLVAPALGDIDGDGEPEIVALLEATAWQDPSEEAPLELPVVAAAFDRHGTLEWISDLPISDDVYLFTVARSITTVNLYDLDQDGTVEVFAGNRILAGATGAEWSPGFEHPGGESLVTDLDSDGIHELVLRDGIYAPDLTRRCAFGSHAWASAVADVDGDGKGEVVQTGRGELLIFDQDCTLVTHRFAPDGGRMGPATLADYDGDGAPEIGVASAEAYFVFEADGTERWRHTVSDYSSNMTGSTVYDFEGDGYAEVVYAGEESLWMFSGQQGVTRLEDQSHYSRTMLEYPITVDIDNDGQVEIVVGDNYGIRVVGDEDEGWVDARQVWNQHAYSIQNINDDLTIPTYQAPNWPRYNSFRSADLRENNGNGAYLVDAQPYPPDVCEIECEAGIVQVVVRPGNAGLADALNGIDLAVYAEQTDGSRILLSVIPAEPVLLSGYATEGVVLELAMTDIPTGTLILVADDDGTGTGVIEECDETNNELRLEGLCADE